MTSFPSGQLFLREFSTMSEAHLNASQLASLAVEAGSLYAELRLVEVSPTAGGAWVCAWLPTDSKTSHSALAKKFEGEIVDVDTTVLNAMLSLGPKPGTDATFVGILESESIAEVLRAASAYSKAGQRLLEVRIKRSGRLKGAYAFFALRDSHVATLEENIPMTVMPLVGDYRRFF